MDKSIYFKTILSYFQSMDIEKLRLYLKDEYSYQNTTKEIFLNEIASIFEAHQNLGDTELLMYSGNCNASSNACDGCGKEGYRFVGNNSRNYIDLIFEIKGEDINDIFDCSNFKTNEEITTLGYQADIYINQEDKITFHKSPEYWSKVYAAETAYSEIITTPASRLDFEELNYWIEKHTIISKKIGSYDIFQPRMKWSAFSMLYTDLKDIKNYILNHRNDLETALRERERAIIEEQHIKWVLKFESLYKNAPFDLKYQFEKENDYYIFQKRNPIYFSGEEFTLANVFLSTYKEDEMELLSKYNTYTSEEQNEIYNNDDVYNSGVDITSLNFHLNRRKAMEEIGIDIPFFLSKNERE